MRCFITKEILAILKKIRINQQNQGQEGCITGKKDKYLPA